MIDEQRAPLSPKGKKPVTSISREKTGATIRKSVGRPSSYTQETANAICEAIVLGDSLRTISSREGMPVISTIFKWIGEHPKFSNQYAIAKEAQADTLADDMEDIARDNKIEVKRARLIIDTRKWTASKLKPKKYGDKIDVTTDGDKIGQVVFTNVIPRPDRKS